MSPWDWLELWIDANIAAVIGTGVALAFRQFDRWVAEDEAIRGGKHDGE